MEDNKDREEIYSNRVRAGKRTYFFDVKSTRSNDYYLTITESKKRFKNDGFSYEKHKIFLYKEDLIKFKDALEDAVEYLKTELLPDYDFAKERGDDFEGSSNNSANGFSNENVTSEVSENDSDLKWD